MANAALRRVLFGYLAFHIAEFATWVAILLYAYEVTGPASVGLVAVIQLVPAAVAAAPAGSLGDRFPRERVLGVGYVVQALAMLATAATMWAGLAIPIVYGCAALAATSLVVTRPTQSALLPALSSTPNDLTAANGAAGVVEGGGVLIGPLIAAAILVESTTAAVYLASGVALAVAALATIGLKPRGGLATLSLPPAQMASAGAGGADEPAADVGDRSPLAGLRAITRDRDARLIVGLLTVRTLMIGAADVLFVLIALELLGIGEPGAGILNAALGAGAIVGGALTFALIGREGLALAAAAGAILWGVAIALIGMIGIVVLAPILVVVGGAGLAVVDVAGRTLLQRSIRDEVLARVFGLQESLAMAALAVGSVTISILSEALGLTVAIAVAAVFLPLMVALSWTRMTALDRRAAVPVRAIALLRSTPLFAPLPLPQLEAIARRGTWLTFPSATEVIREGDPGDRYYVLASGAVRVDQGGRHLRILDEAGSGFGEIALLRNVPRTATVTSTSEIAVFAVDRAPFLAAVTGHPDAFAAASRAPDREPVVDASDGNPDNLTRN